MHLQALLTLSQSVSKAETAVTEWCELQGSEAWTQMGDFTASAQLSLLHTALMQQDGELLGQGAGKEPEALCDSQFGVYANQMDTEVLMAQVS